MDRARCGIRNPLGLRRRRRRKFPSRKPTDKSWAKNPIDHFILARLEKEKLQPSPPATPERWLRRVTFDLTGLPPTQPEIDAFLADTSPAAAETVVDRLLASPRFGERMATPWLDVARYADSFGYQADIDTERLALPRLGDQAPSTTTCPSTNSSPSSSPAISCPIATRDQKLATAFNRIHRKTNEGGSVPEEFRQDGISDRVHTIGTAFMALTFECARCHDHKYDPISAKDYYSMGAFFNSIDEFGLIQGGADRGDVLPQPALQLPTPEQETQLASLQKRHRPPRKPRSPTSSRPPSPNSNPGSAPTKPSPRPISSAIPSSTKPPAMP